MALLGMGGISKTTLAVRIGQQIQNEFQYIIWRSLRNAPPVNEILADLIQFLSNQQNTDADLPPNLNQRVLLLVDYLRYSRCLLVLDNVETILPSGECAGEYREGYEGYGELLRQLGAMDHKSCLVLTSREKPKEFVTLEGTKVKSLLLGGLQDTEARQICQEKGVFTGTDEEWRSLINLYAGHPLALKVVSPTIQDLFAGRLSDFLTQGIAVWGKIDTMASEHYMRLSTLEKEIMFWLAINRDPVSFQELQPDIISPVATQKLLSAVESLARRSLIEKTQAGFTQQPVIMEYMTNRLIEQICEEITTGEIALFNTLSVMKATAKDYIRDTQIRCILNPITERLLKLSSKQTIEQQLKQILSTIREKSPLKPGYAAGNVFNLLCQWRADLTNYDFSQLTIWQADLRGVNLQYVNFVRSQLANCAVSANFSSILSVAFSPDGKLLATGEGARSPTKNPATYRIRPDGGRRDANNLYHVRWLRL